MHYFFFNVDCKNNLTYFARCIQPVYYRIAINNPNNTHQDRVMKFSIKSLIVFFVFFSCLSFSQQNNSEKLNLLLVTGSAEINAPADQAVFTYSVTGFGSSLRQAVEKARGSVSELSKRLFTLGLKPENLYTSNFSSGENNNGKSFLSSSKDFRTYIQVRVTIDSLPMLEEAILVLSESNVESISQVEFRLRNFPAVKKLAREKAIDNALLKARQMAEQTGVRLKKVAYLSEGAEPYSGSQYPNQYNSSNQMILNYQSSGADVPDLIMPGSLYGKSITVRETISLAYEIE